MAEMVDEPVRKRAQLDTSTNYKHCIKCQIPGGLLVQNPKAHGNFLECARLHGRYGTQGYPVICARLADVTEAELQQHNATWHRQCFQETVHKDKLERARKLYEKSLAYGDVSMLALKPKGGRPSGSKQATTVQQPPKCSYAMFTRSLTKPLEKDLCFFCGSDYSQIELHEVRSIDTGPKIRKVVEASENDIWKVNLQPLNPNDARVIDIKYHQPCYVKYVQRAGKTETECAPSNTNGDILAADIEFFSLIDNLLQNGEILSLDEVCKTYRSIWSKTKKTYLFCCG